MAQNFLISSRHGTVYYFRRRVPNDLRDAISRPYLVRTLGTDQRSLAVVLARACAARTDALFQHLRNVKKSNPDSYRRECKSVRGWLQHSLVATHDHQNRGGFFAAANGNWFV